MAGPAERIKIPRNFRLLDEFDHRYAAPDRRGLPSHSQTRVLIFRRSGDCDASCSFGLKDADDMLMSAWTCSIFGPQSSTFDGRCAFAVFASNPFHVLPEPVPIRTHFFQ
jgi:hypothetical protein